MRPGGAEKLGFGRHSQVVGGARDLDRVLDADLARSQGLLRRLQLRQLPRQPDLAIGAAARHVAVVAQPAGGGGVAGFDEALLAVECLHKPRSQSE